MSDKLEKMASQIASFAISDSNPTFQGSVYEMALKFLREACTVQRHPTCIRKIVRGLQAKGVVVYWNIDLTFPPFAGLVIDYGSLHAEIIEVTYDVHALCFLCWAEKSLDSDGDLDKRISEHLEAGWQVDPASKL